MTLVRPRVATIVGMLPLALAARPAPCAADSPATAERVAAWMARLHNEGVVTVHHQVASFTRATFRTRVPCAYRYARVTAKVSLGGAVAHRLAAAVPKPVSEHDASRCAQRGCGEDSTQVSDVRLVFGGSADSLEAQVEFDRGVVTWSDDSTYACASITNADSLVAVLREAVPEDVALGDIRPCGAADPRRATARVDPPVEVRPEPKQRKAPEYPRDAREHGVSGTVWVSALVDRRGKVASTVVWRSIPSLDEAAVRAVEEWRFTPARSGDDPREAWVLIPVKFTLH